MDLIRKAIDGVLYAAAWIAIALLVFLMLSVTYSVLMRFFLNAPPLWIFETSELSLLFFTFLSAGWILKEDGHIKIDLVIVLLDEKKRALLNAITSSLCSVACMFLIWYGAKTTWQSFRLGLVDDKVLPIPDYAINIIVPLGVILLLVQCVRRVIYSLKTLTTSGTTDRDKEPGS